MPCGFSREDVVSVEPGESEAEAGETDSPSLEEAIIGKMALHVFVEICSLSPRSKAQSSLCDVVNLSTLDQMTELTLAELAV